MTTGRALYEHHHTDAWDDLPPGIRRAFDRAAEERANPKLCTQCGRNGDQHSGAYGTCQFTSKGNAQ